MGVKGYKAFKKGMICKDKVYKENATYEETGNEICKPGVMRFCENPFDVLNYYPLVDDNGDIAEFAEVEAQGNVYKENDKSATNKLHIGAKLSFKGFIKACIDFNLEKTKIETNLGATRASGDYSKLAASGNGSVVMAAGYNSIARAKKAVG